MPTDRDYAFALDYLRTAVKSFLAGYVTEDYLMNALVSVSAGGEYDPQTDYAAALLDDVAERHQPGQPTVLPPLDDPGPHPRSYM